jgi:large conductance mechanosensitive channel
MPVVGRLTGGVDFSDMKITIQEAHESSKAVTINYGTFVTIVVDFVIVAFAVFLLVKAVNRLKKKEAALPLPPTPPRLRRSF